MNTESQAFATPPVDIFEGQKDYILAVDLPGVKKDDINVSLDNGKLAIDASRGENGTALRYRRVFDVDRTVDETGLRAELDGGVLTIVVPKVEAKEPITIPVMLS